MAQARDLRGRFISGGGSKGIKDSLESLPGRLSRYGAALEKNARDATRKAILLCDQVVVMGTPVNLGRARGGWQVTFDSPASAETLVLDPSGGVTLVKNQEDIGRYELGQNLYLSNLVPYIGRLENGSSQQAPNGFMRAGVAAAEDFLGRQKFLAV